MALLQQRLRQFLQRAPLRSVCKALHRKDHLGFRKRTKKRGLSDWNGFDYGSLRDLQRLYKAHTISGLSIRRNSGQGVIDFESGYNKASCAHLPNKKSAAGG